MPIAQVESEGWAPRPVGLGELDRVLGGGLVAGSVTLLGGEPGIGKSTLLLQALSALARQGTTCLLACAEESAQQVRMRAARLGALEPNLWLVAETDLSAILAHAANLVPDVLVVDSIQTVFDPELASAPGSVAQVRECAHRLVRAAKDANRATVLVGHVTKDGALAGPRVLEHVVDTVLSFEGERHHALRLLRAVKHRFGPTSELGLFEMTDDGLIGVPDPGRLFLSDRQAHAPGSVVVPTLEGHRPLVVELQALVAKSPLTMPRRSAQGLDSGRLAMVSAVLEERVGVSLAGADVYALAVGGVRVVEGHVDSRYHCGGRQAGLRSGARAYDQRGHEGQRHSWRGRHGSVPEPRRLDGDIRHTGDRQERAHLGPPSTPLPFRPPNRPPPSPGP